MNFLQAMVFAALIGCLLQTASSCDDDYCYDTYESCLNGCQTNACITNCGTALSSCCGKKKRALRPVPNSPDGNEANDDSFLDVFQDK